MPAPGSDWATLPGDFFFLVWSWATYLPKKRSASSPPPPPGWRTWNGSISTASRARRSWAASRVAYTVQGNKPGTVVFKVDGHDHLSQVSAAARFTVRSPSPAGCDFHLGISTDGGKTWKPFGKAEMPADNEFSSGWVYGTTDIAAANVKSALVRVHLYAGGYQTGLIQVEMYGVVQTPQPQAAEVTYAWKESGQVKTHVEKTPRWRRRAPISGADRGECCG